MELTEVIQFLAHTPPFDTLDDAARKQAASEVTVKYARRGSRILEVGAQNAHLYIVRSGAVELMEMGQSLTARLGEGQCFAYPSLLRGDGIRNGVTALEDTLLYLLPAATFHALRQSHESVRRFFIGAEAERLRAALKANDFIGDTGSSQPVRSLIARDPITCESGTTLKDAAGLMVAENVSTLMVMEGNHLKGIVTDRDIRARAVAEGLPLMTPVDEIMTPDPITVSGGTLVLDALLLMLEKHFHHLPVVGEDGTLVGLISASDILAIQASNLAQVAKNIHNAHDAAAIKAALAPLPTIVSRLVKSGMDGTRVASNIASIGHAVHRRIVALAEQALGTPPVPYCFLVFGSLARRDQTLSSDQDNGLLISDDYDPSLHGQYFEALASRVSDDLNTCGYVYCNGGIMATNPLWRRTLKGWGSHFDGWIRTPEPKALMHASIFFDLALAYGSLPLFKALQSKILEMASGNKLFLAHMVENALASKVPIGFFRRFVLMHDSEHKDRLDIKKNGIAALVDIVRIHALANGIEAVGTEDRLAALRLKGARATSDLDEMLDAWHFLMDVRIAHQTRQADRHEAPDNMVAPDALSPFEREHLRDAFSLIKTHQEGLSRTFAGGYY